MSELSKERYHFPVSLSPKVPPASCKQIGNQETL
jgi:hypothetical protein